MKHTIPPWQEKLMKTFRGRVDKALQQRAEREEELQENWLPDHGLDKQAIWYLRTGRRYKDPRLSTLLKFAQAAGAKTPEEFFAMFTEEASPNKNSPSASSASAST
jgi:hypothetical protein